MELAVPVPTIALLEVAPVLRFKRKSPRKPAPVLKPETWFFEEKRPQSIVGDTRHWVRLGHTTAILVALVLCLGAIHNGVPVDPPPHLWTAARAAAPYVVVAHSGVAYRSGFNYEIVIVGVDRDGLEEIATVRIRPDGTVISSSVLRGDPRPIRKAMLGVAAAGTLMCVGLAWHYRKSIAESFRGPRMRPPANLG